jgi:hypothetical protein
MIYIIFAVCFMLTFWIYASSGIWKHKVFMLSLSSIINIGLLVWAISFKTTKPVSFESIQYFLAFAPFITFFILIMFRFGGRVLGEILESIGDILS